MYLLSKNVIVCGWAVKIIFPHLSQNVTNEETDVCCINADDSDYIDDKNAGVVSLIASSSWSFIFKLSSSRRE